MNASFRIPRRPRPPFPVPRPSPLSRHRIAVSVPLFVILALACSGRAPRVRPTDEYLTTYLSFVHDWMETTNRHVAESEAMRRVSARYSPADAPMVGHDPDLLALLNRQREEMAPLMARAPHGPLADAIGATIA